MEERLYLCTCAPLCPGLLLAYVFAEVIAKTMELSCGEARGLSLKWVKKTKTMCTTLEDPSTKVMSCQVVH